MRTGSAHTLSSISLTLATITSSGDIRNVAGGKPLTSIALASAGVWYTDDKAQFHAIRRTGDDKKPSSGKRHTMYGRKENGCPKSASRARLMTPFGFRCNRWPSVLAVTVHLQLIVQRCEESDMFTRIPSVNACWCRIVPPARLMPHEDHG